MLTGRSRDSAADWGEAGIQSTNKGGDRSLSGLRVERPPRPAHQPRLLRFWRCRVLIGGASVIIFDGVISKPHDQGVIGRQARPNLASYTSKQTRNYFSWSVARAKTNFSGGAKTDAEKGLTGSVSDVACKLWVGSRTRLTCAGHMHGFGGCRGNTSPGPRLPKRARERRGQEEKAT